MSLLDRSIGPKLHSVLNECLLSENLDKILEFPPDIPTEVLFSAENELKLTQTPLGLMLAQS